MRALSVVVVAALAGLTAGCGGDAGKGGPAGGLGGTPSAKEALVSLGDLLKAAADEKKPPPAKMSAVEAVEPAYPAAYIGLVKGEIAYAWGHPIGSGSAVLAYEKKAATEAGWVLLQDGTVKEMTAAEFQSATKLDAKK